MVLTVNMLLVNLTPNSAQFERTLMENVIIWSMSELVMDLAYFIVCIIMYKKFWFDRVEKISAELSSIYRMFRKWVSTTYPFLIVGVLGVAFLGFYVLFFVVIRVSAPK